MKNVDPGEVVLIVQKYKSYVSSLCRKYYIVGGTNEDLFEEGIIGILEACKNYNGNSLFEDKFEPFVKLCIKRQLIDAIKHSNTQKNKVLNESVPLVSLDENGEEKSLLDMMFDRNNSTDPLDVFIDKEKIFEKLRLCETQLSDFEKEVFAHYIQGEKQSEIAKSLGKSIKSIDNTIQRIKSKLK